MRNKSNAKDPDCTEESEIISKSFCQRGESSAELSEWYASNSCDEHTKSAWSNYFIQRRPQTSDNFRYCHTRTGDSFLARTLQPRAMFGCWLCTQFRLSNMWLFIEWINSNKTVTHATTTEWGRDTWKPFNAFFLDFYLLSELLPDAIQSDCSKCTEPQKRNSHKVITFLRTRRPQDWKKLTDKYDPQGKFKARLDAGLI